jgi:glycosyltransferase involved in cell wall biosynthesis
MTNTITFIIPSLNRDTIINSVQSLKNQTNPNWKCIIVYDGVDGEQFDDERITTIKIDKKGLIGANNGQSGLVRNEGIKLCHTEWIGFLDDDDTIHPNYVKKLFQKYSKNDFVVWRMKYQNGLILPEPNRKDLVFARVGISFCYKT